MDKQEFLDKTIEQINKDRECVMDVYNKVGKYLDLVLEKEEGDEEEIRKYSASDVSKIANSMAKIVEGLQRTSEQMVKVASVMKVEPKNVELEDSYESLIEEANKIVENHEG